MIEALGTMRKPDSDQVASCHNEVFRTALRMVGDADGAADLAQEAFRKAYKNWGRFHGGPLPSTYLYTVLRNCMRNKRI
jgi:DNA-directed RNA polymerase specialized sigma24 family protein